MEDEVQLEITIKELEEKEKSKLAGTNSEPQVEYNPETTEITFQGKSIFITPNTDQADVCKKIFKNRNSMKKSWSWDEFFNIRDMPDKKDEDAYKQYKDQWRKIHGAVRAVNIKIGLETGIKNLIIFKKKTVHVNPKYL